MHLNDIEKCVLKDNSERKVQFKRYVQNENKFQTKDPATLEVLQSSYVIQGNKRHLKELNW